MIKMSSGHTGPRGGQKSKFENAVFGLKPSYWMLTIMFKPKNVDTSTFRPQKLTMSKRGFHLDFLNMANLLSKMMVLRNPKSTFPLFPMGATHFGMASCTLFFILH